MPRILQGSKKARHKAILALIVAYLQGQIHGHCSPQTTCPRILLRDQGPTRLSPSTKTNMLNVPPAKSQGTIPRRGKKLQLQHQNLKEHQHVYNSTYWLRPLSPAHQQGPSTLTEAPRYIMLTAAY
ncbi:hypothetical protein F2Q70_00011453 [Brassica cretica]|uniref:Secreted protein n=1 Tax=Brassica cretica TaxID=69181 RepID=A0A8S9MDQ2_BRACR|nr:hypothetical protein F2Q70_00011453 [Brassica cretica]